MIATIIFVILICLAAAVMVTDVALCMIQRKELDAFDVALEALREEDEDDENTDS